MQKRPIQVNPGRFSDAMEEYGPQLYRYLIHRLGNGEDAHDLAQEAYLRLLRIERKKIIKNPQGYLFRIAANLANEFIMQKKQMPPTIDLDSLIETGDMGDSQTFEKRLEHGAMIDRLEKILESLPPIYRAILIMKKRDGMSRKEIADELGISVHTVKKYLTRATARCREQLTEL